MNGATLGPRDNGANRWLLRPELVESIFYMWRYTHDPIYREWGWDIVQAIERHCRTENGYARVTQTNTADPAKDDMMDSWFFAETLKYLFLLFEEDSVLPLDSIVFNTEAHPLSIRGRGRRALAPVPQAKAATPAV
jgi:mannosyl-oligosaccharide alpha-1,2-mannosidase